MPMKQKFAVWLFDEALVDALKAGAQAREESVSAFVSRVVRQALTGGAPGDCPQCAKTRARDEARRRAAGVPVRKVLPKIEPRSLHQHVCPICDVHFTPENRNGHEQIYCGRGNRRCMKYAQRYGVEKGRLKYAAKADTFTD